MPFGKERMIIDLKEIRKKGKSETDFYFEYVPDAQLCSIPNVEIAPPVKVQGKLRLIDKTTVYAEGEVFFTLKGECTTCLKPAEKSFAAEFAEDFSSAGEENAYPYRSEIVDLTRAINDLLILEMPLTFVCGEDCKAEY